METDWINQVEKICTLQKVAFIDDDGDEHFYDCSSDEDNDRFYDSSKDFNLNVIDGVKKNSVNNLVNISSRKSKIIFLAIGALTLNPLMHLATALAPNHKVNTLSKRATHAL